MVSKKGLLASLLLIVLILLTLFLSYLAYYFYFTEGSSGELVPISIKELNKCDDLQDDYKLPDFEKIMQKLSNEPIVEDIPSKAKISLKFYHFVGNCRKWDKVYLLRDGKIEDIAIESDIDIWIDSDYANRVMEEDLCDVIIDARANGDLGQSFNVGKTKLLWTYRGLLKYRKCVGL